MTNPTVLDYLAIADKARGVSYRHEWGNSYPVATWTAASVLLVGVVGPTVINLLAFGRLFRPREPKGIDLRHVCASTQPVAVAATSADGPDLAQFNNELAATLAAADGDYTGVGSAANDSAAPVRALATQPAPAAAGPGGAGRDRTYDAKEDDFYPTERRHPHPTSRSITTEARD
jgi:hypothetical protein